MKVVVIGGTGLIGSKVVDKLNEHGHEAIAAAPNTGVNTLTGEGLAEALTGAQVVVDVANSPSFEDGPAWDFFTTATGNVLTTAESAGLSHVVALSVVGTDRLLASGYFRAKNAQEQLISEAAIPFSIVRATQFFEFVGRIADSATDGDTVRISPALIQPMAADDVATAVARTAVGQPSAASSKSQAPTGIHSTTSSAPDSAHKTTPGAFSRIHKRATSASYSTTTPCCPARTRRCSPRASRTGLSTTRSPRPASMPAQRIRGDRP